MDLSLTGSQLSSSARRPNSAKSSGRQSPARVDGASARRDGRGRVGSQGSAELSSKHSKQLSTPHAGGDFSHFFENPVQPKILKAKQHVKSAKPKPVWATPNSSARSENDSEKGSSQNTYFSHSVFQPSSVRSSSTLDGTNTDRTEVAANSAFALDLKEISASPPTLNGSPRLQLNNSLLANNRKSQSMSPGNRTPLGEMENAFQNIKHKMPVNQVATSNSSSLHHSLTAHHMRHLANDMKECSSPRQLTPEAAARRIQNWYRRYIRNAKRTRASQAAMRRLLANKRDEMSSNSTGQSHLHNTVDQERKLIRQEKARRARQEAIEELHKKRQAMRENETKTSPKVHYLQYDQKVSPKPSNASRNFREMGARPKVRPRSADRSSRRNEPQPSVPRPPSPEAEVPEEEIEAESEMNTARNGVEGKDDVSQVTSKPTTIDDLMDTLKKLEAEERFGSDRPDKNEHRPSWLDDLEKTSTENENLTSENLSKLQPPKMNLSKSGLLTDDKLRSIMSFLDEVETGERLDEIDQRLQTTNPTVAPETATAAAENSRVVAPLVPSAEELEQMEQASAVASEVTSQMLTQKLELEEKKRSVSMLQKALNQQRELTIRHARETEKEMKHRLDVQKEEFEETIKRHLGFIDQLIDDKKSLSEKCETLVKELKTVDKKYSDKIKTLQDNQEVEIRKLKEVNAAAEKLRREKWIDEKTKKIKEMTVKGLEPEIQRLIAKHKTEIQKMKSIHEAELLASDERAGQRYIQMTEELRDQLAREKESACARERELARTTYEKQLRQEEEAFQQQRQRLYAEVKDEKERLHSGASRQRAELDRLQRQLEDSHSAGAQALKDEYERAREEQERRHHTEIKQLREQLTLEKHAWEENYMKKQETWLLQRERELKETVRKDRDKEIELVLRRFEEEGQSTRDECERVAENRIKRVRDKYEAELTELELLEKQTSEKYNTAKARLAVVEGENERLSALDGQKDREITDLKKLLEKLNKERDSVSDIIRQEFADRIVATEEENKRVKMEMSELRARHRLELDKSKQEVEQVQRAKDAEMEEVHKRVKQAIQKKEEVVQQMRDQYQAAVKRADHLEGLLEQQRKQLLTRK